MSQSATDPQEFFRERIPAQFNRALEAQAALGENGRRVYDAMRAVSATIRVDVEGAGGGTFYLNIRAGRMQSESGAAQPPFLTLIQDRRAFEQIAREAGDSAMALLGGLSGLASEMKLTRARVDAFSELAGTVLIEVTGPGGFALRTHFGAGAPATPVTTIRVDEDAYRALRAGTLDPQSAFMSQRIAIEGDMRVAMQLALAAVAPD